MRAILNIGLRCAVFTLILECLALAMPAGYSRQAPAGAADVTSLRRAALSAKTTATPSPAAIWHMAPVTASPALARAMTRGWESLSAANPSRLPLQRLRPTSAMAPPSAFVPFPWTSPPRSREPSPVAMILLGCAFLVLGGLLRPPKA